MTLSLDDVYTAGEVVDAATAAEAAGLIGDVVGEHHDLGRVYGTIDPGRITMPSSLDPHVWAMRAGATGPHDDCLAPEQRVTGTDVDVRADVYAASAVIGRAVYGQRWRQVLIPQGPARATGLEPSGSEPVAFELRRGLSARPEDRHDDIREWANAVTDALAEQAALDRADQPLAARRPVVRAVAALIVVATLVLAFATVL